MVIGCLIVLAGCTVVVEDGRRHQAPPPPPAAPPPQPPPPPPPAPAPQPAPAAITITIVFAPQPPPPPPPLPPEPPPPPPPPPPAPPVEVIVIYPYQPCWEDVRLVLCREYFACTPVTYVYMGRMQVQLGYSDDEMFALMWCARQKRVPLGDVVAAYADSNRSLAQICTRYGIL
ncbi:MAG TPA: hypothetical protein VMU54_18275, partial [Planctomycetota bacterium]|nr:hypothetical protein [Planctomycetota bacterium]